MYVMKESSQTNWMLDIAQSAGSNTVKACSDSSIKARKKGI